MIPVLFDENETEFKNNGLGLLKDTIYCYCEEERNGSYEIELAYKVGSFLFSEIKCNRYVKAKANNRYNPQIFRIYYISKPLNGKIIIKGEHISYELKDNFIESAACTGNCQLALNTLNSNAAYKTGFNFHSDITSSSKYSAELKKFWDCIIGTQGSIIDTYGNDADIVRDNFNIYVLKTGGQDNNVLISYKKNMIGFTCEEDWTGCITRIYPYAIKDDKRIALSEKYVDSEYISRDKKPRIQPIDFTEKFEDDEDITEDKLRKLAIQYFKDSTCDIPTLVYSIEAVALSKTEEFKNSKLNENIEILDFVIVRHELYGIDTKIKILKVKYDSLLECYKNIELNFKKSTITNTINNTIKKIDEIKEEAANATNNLKVVMEKRDSEIELSIENEKEDRKVAIELLDGEINQRVTEEEFGTYKKQTAREISQKVDSGNGFTTELKQNVDAFQFLFEEASGSKTEITRDGITVYKGGFKIKDNSGNTIFWVDTNGILRAEHLWANDLTLDETSSETGSSLWNVLYKMKSITVKELKTSRLTINEEDFYISDDMDSGFGLKEYIERVVNNM